jgi:hypothetical protein
MKFTMVSAAGGALAEPEIAAPRMAARAPNPNSARFSSAWRRRTGI